MDSAPFFPSQLPRLETSAGPLEDGDCLTAKEFMRRFESLPAPARVELIEGIVHVGSATSLPRQAEAHHAIVSCLRTYAEATPGCILDENPLVLLDRENVTLPNGVLRIRPECAGKTRISEKGYLVGSPELTVEILVARGINDLRDKLSAFRRNAVPEFFVWRLDEAGIEWFQLEKGGYVANLPGPNNLLWSRVFPGLSLNVNALLNWDFATLANTLKVGLNRPEHAAFAGRLASRSRGR